MRRNHGHKELDQIQTLRKENDKLKRQISSLRKQLARIDLDRYGQVKTIVEEHLAQEEQQESTENMLKKLKEAWKCHNCKDGYLEIFTYNKINETWYRRECTNCSHTTKAQRYSPDKVQGIVREEKKKDK